MTERIKSKHRLGFPKTVAAVRAAEDLSRRLTSAQFAIGDALIEECGEPGPVGVNNGALAKLRACAKELAAQFPAYTVDHLRDLRATAARFKDGDRSPSASWTVHLAAGDPETLRKAERKAKAEGIPLTVAFVEKFKKVSMRRAEAEVSPLSDDDCLVREFRTAAADARAFAESVVQNIASARDMDVADLIREAESVVAAWQVVADALREPVPMLEAAE